MSMQSQQQQHHGMRAQDLMSFEALESYQRPLPPSPTQPDVQVEVEQMLSINPSSDYDKPLPPAVPGKR